MSTSRTVGLLLVATASALIAVVVGVTADSLAGFAVLLAVSLGSVGAAMVTWVRSSGLDDEATEQREPLCISSAEAAVLHAELDLARRTVGRRRVVRWAFGGSLAALGVAALSPFVPLGPRPSGDGVTTAWRAGRRLVDPDGRGVRVGDVPPTTLVTAFPEGHLDAAESQVLLVRLDPGSLDAATAALAVDGWVAYSRLCTHLGCPVGMAGLDDREPRRVHQLVCPCHQSVFDPTDGARPVGGPAPRPLPQLPLGRDDQGYLVATGDFDVPVGPASWRRP